QERKGREGLTADRVNVVETVRRLLDLLGPDAQTHETAEQPVQGHRDGGDVLQAEQTQRQVVQGIGGHRVGPRPASDRASFANGTGPRSLADCDRWSTLHPNDGRLHASGAERADEKTPGRLRASLSFFQRSSELPAVYRPSLSASPGIAVSMRCHASRVAALASCQPRRELSLAFSQPRSRSFSTSSNRLPAYWALDSQPYLYAGAYWSYGVPL